MRRRHRKRPPTMKARTLRMGWGCLPHNGPDICYVWGEGCAKADAHMLHNFIGLKNSSGRTVVQELEERGYDIESLQFSIRLKPEAEA